jgi:hypothetical protein
MTPAAEFASLGLGSAITALAILAIIKAYDVGILVDKIHVSGAARPYFPLTDLVKGDY